jgi:hypothetical protein
LVQSLSIAPQGDLGCSCERTDRPTKETPMNDRRYIKPPWMQRHVGNRMSVLFGPSLISKLSVRGRRSGRWHTTPVAVLEHNGVRYLVSYRGASDWARNLDPDISGLAGW